MQKGVATSDGFKYVEMTPQEVAELNELQKIIWHNNEKNIQVFMTYSQNASLMQSDYGIALLTYFKSINPFTVNESEGIYIYLGELYDQHRMLLESFRATINEKV